MLDRLLCWYVFSVYKKSTVLLNFIVMILIFILASCLNNVLAAHQINWFGWIWHAVLLAEILILVNVFVHRHLNKNLIIHSECYYTDCERFFLALDQETGAVDYFFETDFVLRPKREAIVLVHFTIPILRDEEISERGLIVKRAGSVCVEIPKTGEAVSFDIFLEMTGEHDLNTLIDFISKQYYNNGIAYTSYENYVIESFYNQSLTWIHNAYYEADKASAVGYEPSLYSILENFKKIVEEKFRPHCLPNIISVAVNLSGGEERWASAYPPFLEEVKAPEEN
jgi:hypothetical protein